MRAIVAGSKTTERVVLTTTQLFALDGRPLSDPRRNASVTIDPLAVDIPTVEPEDE
jgi:hypothetical protein